MTLCVFEGRCSSDCPRRYDDCEGNPLIPNDLGVEE